MTRVRTRQRRMRRPPQKYKSKRSNRDKIFKGGASQFYIPRKAVDDVWGSIRGDRYNKFGGPYVKQEKKDSEGNSVGLYVKSGDGINEKICVKSKSDTWWITYSSDMQDRSDGTKRDIGEIFYDRYDATIFTFVASEISEKVENIPNIFCTITTPQGTSLEDCISGNLAVTIGKDKYVSTVLLLEPEPAPPEPAPQPAPSSQEPEPMTDADIEQLMSERSKPVRPRKPPPPTGRDMYGNVPPGGYIDGGHNSISPEVRAWYAQHGLEIAHPSQDALQRNLETLAERDAYVASTGESMEPQPEPQQSEPPQRTDEDLYRNLSTDYLTPA